MLEMRAPRNALVAIGLTAGVLLIQQIAVTRILSVLTNYHGAFVVIGLVMLALSASASVVYVHLRHPSRPPDRDSIARVLEVTGLGSGLAVVALVALNLIPWGPLYPLLLLFVGLIAFLLFFGMGYAIAWLLSQWPKDTGRLYWFDLMGASLGCLLVVPLLDAGPPMLTLAVTGLVLVLAGILLRSRPGIGMLAWVLPTLSVAVLTVAAPSLLRLNHVKGVPHDGIVFERWNHLAQVVVSEGNAREAHDLELLRGAASEAEAARIVGGWGYGWGFGRRHPEQLPQVRWIMLDGDAGTQIVGDGARDVGEPLRYLEHDVTTLAYAVKPNPSRVFVIGGGGGRDVLTALHAGARHVEVGELNPLVVHVVEEVFGEFSGGPYSRDDVTLRLGDARSTLARSEQSFDLIQMSMIDTWASSVSGAMVLSESALYTREAFATYFERLADDGVLTVSRWADTADGGELARTLALAGRALMDIGVERPEDHLVLATGGGQDVATVGTLVIKKTPFSDVELARARERVAAVGLDLVWPGRGPLSDDVPAMLRGDPQIGRSLRIDLRPPTDDRPFFFELRPVFQSLWWAVVDRDLSPISRGTGLIFALLLIYLLVGRLLIIEPLRVVNRRLPVEDQVRLAAHGWPMLFFTAIGVSFLFVEVAVLQRTMTFLGHPTRALSVVLFSLLLFSGLGAALSTRFRSPRLPAIALVVCILLTAFGVPPLFQSMQGLPLLARVGVTVGITAPLGALMGMMFPLGVRRLQDAGLAPLIPWLWSINGLAGVLASLLAILMAMSVGYTAVLVAGALGYLLMLGSALMPWAPRPVPPDHPMAVPEARQAP